VALADALKNSSFLFCSSTVPISTSIAFVDARQALPTKPAVSMLTDASDAMVMASDYSLLPVMTVVPSAFAPRVRFRQPALRAPASAPTAAYSRAIVRVKSYSVPPVFVQSPTISNGCSLFGRSNLIPGSSRVARRHPPSGSGRPSPEAVFRSTVWPRFVRSVTGCSISVMCVLTRVKCDMKRALRRTAGEAARDGRGGVRVWFHGTGLAPLGGMPAARGRAS